MNIVYGVKFEREYKKLTKQIRESAKEKERMFRVDPFDLKLKSHKLHGPLKDFWAFSLNSRYRIIFDFLDKNTVRFYSVGGHDIYE